MKSRTNIKILLITLLCGSLSACSVFHKQQVEGVVAEVNGQYLTCAELDDITRGMEDSAAVADAYIRQWATQIIEYAEAKDRASNELEAMVEDYRRSLYIHEYEQRLVTKYSPQTWQDSVVAAFYEQQQSRFVLHDNIVQGILLVMPLKTPQLANLKKWLTNLDEKNTEKIEKYAYRYATGYEYFPNEWKTTNQIALRLPLELEALQQQMKRTNQIIVEDSMSVYVLQLTDKHFIGEKMPLSYAKEEIEEVLLNRWKVTFLQQHREELYKDALRYNKLKIYEK
ncbi:MAG: hypothetical protein MJZ79_07280 [Paludibacteraceae bacterium]|nr:hypothetical protein [Paludibacteraceae bacterium]